MGRIVTVRPDGTHLADTDWFDNQTSNSVGGNAHLRLNDNNDATFVYGIMSGSPVIELHMAQYILAADERCAAARNVSRIRSMGLGQFNLDVWLKPITMGDGGGANFTLERSYFDYAHGPWDWREYSQAAMDATRCAYRMNGAPQTTPAISESYLDFWIQNRPTVSITSPTANQKVFPLRPTIYWNYNNQGDEVYGHRVKIFTAAVVEGGGFNADSSATVWDSTDVSGAATEKTVGVDLTYGASYYAYVQIATNFLGTWWRSTWAAVKFSINNPATASAITTTPTTPITSTTQPSINWTFTDVDGDTQQWYYIRVFPESVYSAPGFNYNTDSGAAWVSGAVQSTPARSAQTGVLTPNVNYRAYVWVSETGANQRWSTAPGISSPFVIQTAPGTWAELPATPEVLSATPDVTNQRMIVTAQGEDNLLTRNQSSAETSTVGFVNNVNATITRDTTTGVPLFGVAAFRMGATAAGIMSAATMTNIADGRTGVPVLPNRKYRAQAAIKAQTTGRFVWLNINFFTSAGAFVSSVTGPMAMDATGAYTTLWAYAVAPATAAYAVAIVNVGITGSAPALGEGHYVDQLFLGPTGNVAGNLLPVAAAGFETDIGGWGPNTATPSVLNARNNLLSVNAADINTDATAWGATNATLARDTVTFQIAPASLSLTSIAAGSMFAELVAAQRVPVTVGATYSAAAWTRAATVVRSTLVTIRWFTAGGAVISDSPGSAATNTTSGWTKVTATGTAPATAATAAIFITISNTAAAGEVHYADPFFIYAGSYAASNYYPPGVVLEGQGSMRVQTTAASTSSAMITGTKSTYAAPVTPGKSYTISFWSKANSSTRTILASAHWWTAAGGFVSSSSGSGATNSATVWTEHRSTFTAPAGAAYVTPEPVIISPASGEQHFFDNFAVMDPENRVWYRGGFAAELGTVSDAFGRSDSASSLGTADTGGAWTAHVGTWGLSSGRAYLATAAAASENYASLSSTHLVDGYVEADITLSTVRANVGLMFRGTDHNNTLMARFRRRADNTVDGLELYKRDAGTYTLLASLASAGLVLGSTYRLRVEFYGGQIRILIDGVLRLSYLMLAADLTTAGSRTRYGIYMAYDAATDGFDNGASRIDNFVARLPVTQQVTVERSLDSGTTWTVLRTAQKQALNNQEGVFYDYEVPLYTTALYRMRSYGTEVSEYASAYSANTEVSAQLTATSWWLKDPIDPTLNIPIKVQPPFSFSRKEPQQVYEPLGRKTSIVVTDGPRGISGTLTLLTRSKAEYDQLNKLINNGRTLLLADVLGRSWYVKFGEAHDWEMVLAQPAQGETYPIRHLHRVALPFVEVAAP